MYNVKLAIQYNLDVYHRTYLISNHRLNQTNKSRSSRL